MVRKSSLCRREGVSADSKTDEEDEAGGGRDPGSAHHLPQGQQGLRDRLPHLPPGLHLLHGRQGGDGALGDVAGDLI